ncbi:LL-diaminopimelate aminotransferase [Rhynchospora pubera]|uniref:LL-diaminopimelate aminotransferase n=1 Tax=Rhynchospora pubera TaxID=906938 RepID=A0AAV8C8V0_9POAL|nr:LL-diaminopimelate aminotransferase [Rhynchospora pubera]
MALRYTSPCFSTISRKTPKSVTKAVMLPTRCHAQPMKTIKTFNFSSTDNKIYEDKAIGIIGYKDKNGEVIYEGFDEGPRLPHEELEQINNAREASTRAQLQKLLFDTFQTDHHCAKDAVLTSIKSEDEIINK